MVRGISVKRKKVILISLSWILRTVYKMGKYEQVNNLMEFILIKLGQ